MSASSARRTIFVLVLIEDRANNLATCNPFLGLSSYAGEPSSGPLHGEVTAQVRKLKHSAGEDVVILGSGELIRSLMPDYLIDEFFLMIHPVVLSSGTRMFPEEGAIAQLQLVESITTGVIMATYRSSAGDG